ncbi:hypothetical protein [Streptomyces indicus]|uniref:Lipoprotein n=1 Tax=Streptomyces indicus TaxID=417292 RepID=A0A1G9GZ58_9ACTN|nr:hypothetical protein [Streptomyces indicus]SDL05946.1 hypothetical protein SAMN05421806_117105 [Streptomyces indicus]
MSTLVRSRWVLRAAAAAAGLVLLGACGRPEGLHVQGPAISPSPQKGPVYVADSMGQPLRRPTSVGLSELVTVSGLKWHSWGGPAAEASGKLSGPWCLPGCAEKPYDVTVTLSGLQQQERVAYYRRATVVPDDPAALPAEAVKVQLQAIRLNVPVY